MFSFLNPIKGYLVAGFVIFIAGLIATIKILTLTNARKELENAKLKEDALNKEKAHGDEIKRAEFKGKQQAKAKEANDISELEKALIERGEVKDEDGYITITR